MEIHEVGTYSSPKAGQMHIYMVEHPGGIEGDLGRRAEAKVLYNMECSSSDNLIFWPDWLSFAHKVNAIAGEQVLDPMADMAEEQGLVVATGLECPDCGCRVVDALELVEVESAAEGEEWVFCHGCGEAYQIGKN